MSVRHLTVCASFPLPLLPTHYLTSSLHTRPFPSAAASDDGTTWRFADRRDSPVMGGVNSLIRSEGGGGGAAAATPLVPSSGPLPNDSEFTGPRSIQPSQVLLHRHTEENNSAAAAPAAAQTTTTTTTTAAGEAVAPTTTVATISATAPSMTPPQSSSTLRPLPELALHSPDWRRAVEAETEGAATTAQKGSSSNTSSSCCCSSESSSTTGTSSNGGSSRSEGDDRGTITSGSRGAASGSSSNASTSSPFVTTARAAASSSSEAGKGRGQSGAAERSDGAPNEPLPIETGGEGGSRRSLEESKIGVESSQRDGGKVRDENRRSLPSASEEATSSSSSPAPPVSKGTDLIAPLHFCETTNRPRDACNAQWLMLWTTAAYAPEKPDDEEQRLLRWYFSEFPDRCGGTGPEAFCYTAAVRRMPPRVRDRRELLLWLCLTENFCRKKAGLEPRSCCYNELMKRWRYPDGYL